MTPRFQSLRFLAKIYQFIGLLTAGLTLLGFVVSLCASISTPRIDIFGISVTNITFGTVLFIEFFIVLGGLFAALTTYAFGAFIMLMLAIEENTRKPYDEEYKVPPVNTRPDLAPSAPRGWSEFRPGGR